MTEQRLKWHEYGSTSLALFRVFLGLSTGWYVLRVGDADSLSYGQNFFILIATLFVFSLTVGYRSKLSHLGTFILIYCTLFIEMGSEYKASVESLLLLIGGSLFLPLSERFSIDHFRQDWLLEEKDDKALNRDRVTNPLKISSHSPLFVLIALLIEDTRELLYQRAVIDHEFIVITLSKICLLTLLLNTKDLLRLIAFWGGILLPLVACSIWGLDLQKLTLVCLLALSLKEQELRRLSILFRPSASPLTIYYDSDCGVCHALARVGVRLDLYGLLLWYGRKAPAVLPEGMTAEEFEDLRQQTLITHPSLDPTEHSADDIPIAVRQIAVRQIAVSEIMKRLPLLFILAPIVSKSGSIGESAYRAFADRRHLISKRLGYGVCGLKELNEHLSMDFSSLSESSSHQGIANRQRELWAELLRCFIVSLGLLSEFY